MTTIHAAKNSPPHPLWIALALSMGAAVSLGITRFSYGLLLPPMRADLGWSYTLAGGMNTANAAGYLLGALSTPALMRRFGPVRLLVVGALCASVFMAASGFFISAPALLVQRLLAGLASAWVFVAGGLLAARLGERRQSSAGFLLGIYYGGTGFGIGLSALLVPQVLQAASTEPHGWAWAWWALAAAGLGATLVLWMAAQGLEADETQPGHRKTLEPEGLQASHAGLDAGLATASSGKPSVAGQPEALAFAGPPPSANPKDLAEGSLGLVRRFGWALAGYACFGAGYIGYMTFVIALLREQGAATGDITLFYALLGLACIVSSRLWAGLLDRFRGGQPQAVLNALLGIATVLPVLSSTWTMTMLSGLLFGGVFLSVVASTTALVRHNLPRAQWAAGISVFTVIFALGQIVGPTATGWISDGEGGLARGLVFSALTLWLGALLASRQKAST